MIINVNTPDDLSMPRGLSLRNYYTQFVSMFLVSPSYRWSNTTDFKTESVWLAGIKAGSIIPIHDIINVDFIGEEDFYEDSLQDRKYPGKKTKDIFIIKYDFDIAFHKKLKSYDQSYYDIVFADVNNNLYAWLNTSLIGGYEQDLIHTQKMPYGSVPEHAWSKVYIELSDSDQLNENGVIEKVDFNISDLYFVNVTIQEIVSPTENDLWFQVVDSIYDCPINGLSILDITIVDVFAGTITISSLRNDADGLYKLTSASDFKQGTITIDTTRYYGQETYAVRGESWGSLTTPVSTFIANIKMSSSNIGYAAGNSDTLLYTTDGTSWNTITSGTSGVNFEGITINPGYDQEFWACGSGGNIIQCITLSCSSQTSGTTNYLRSISAYDSNNVLVCGNSGTIRVTSDAGVNWNASTSGVATTLDSIYARLDGSIAYACGSTGVILKTTNFGTSWSSLTSTVSTDLKEIFFISNTVGWCVGSSGVVLKTINGSTWTQTATITGESIMSVFFVDANIGFICTVSGKIYISTDGGTIWTEQESNTTEFLNSIYMISSVLGFACGNTGTILKYE